MPVWTPRSAPAPLRSSSERQHRASVRSVVDSAMDGEGTATEGDLLVGGGEDR